MRRNKRFLAACLAGCLVLSLSACRDGAGLAEGSGGPEETASGSESTPASQTGPDDFQKNLHQAVRRTYGLPTFVETGDGYYMGYGSLYYLEKETGKTSILCAKPDCDHTDPNVCNAMINARYLLAQTDGERIYYVGNIDEPKEVQCVRTDGTGRETVQTLKYNETSSSPSSDDWSMYHRGYIYYVSDDILYRVQLGVEKDSAEEIWRPENAGSTQSNGGMIELDPNAIRYSLWADGDMLYFMANMQTAKGTKKDVLFQCGLDGSDVHQVWATPDADEVGEWERTGVTVNQWYESGGYLYFYLAGNGIWRTELSTGETQLLADTKEQAAFGSAVFSESAVCVLNDIPKFNEFAEEPHPGSYTRFDADTVFLYSLDGTFRKEISLQPLLDEMEHASFFDLLFCDGTDLYFIITAYTYDDPNNPDLATGRSITLRRVNYETGTASQVCRLA